MRASTRLRTASILSVGLVTALLSAPAIAANDEPTGPEAIQVQASESWASSIDPEALATYLRPTDRSVLVIGVGEGGPRLEDAVESLETQFRAVPRGLKVVGASWSGDPETEDQKIVAKAAGTRFKPDVALVARMFEDELIVTLYDAEGEVIDGFITTRGQPLAPRAERSEGGGVKAQALDAVGEVASERAEVRPASASGTRITVDVELEQAFRAQRLSFTKQRIYDPYTGYVAHVGEGNEIIVGQHGRPMNWGQALRHMGHTELADKYDRQHSTRVALLVVGSVATVALPVGAATFIMGEDGGMPPGWKTAGGVAMGVGAVGAITLISGIAMGEAVNKNDMRYYVGEFNTSLRRRLSAGREEREQLSLRSSIRQTWRLSPSVSRQGASLSFSARF